jgi:hypothetical protein
MQHHERYRVAHKAIKLRARDNRFRTVTFSALVAMSALIPGVGQAETSLPQLDGDKHLGVATCASSTCHGAASPRDASNVLQNEYLTWHRRDRHSRAYEILLQERSQRISRRLGLGPAQKADACLDCHADNVAPANRGPEFQISDGIGCEGCHGGAERWIRSHADSSTSHADNLASGLYPTEDPAARTRLCMSCHYSHPETPMTHELMAAGHPPLLFDLNTFTQIQPAHHEVDADYRRRKGAVSAATEWAIGEATGSGILLETVASDMASGSGLFPELYHFNCNACHHALGRDWPLRPTGLPAGSVPLEDASLRILGNILAGIDSSLAGAWSEGLADLHRATRNGRAEMLAASRALHVLADKARSALDSGSIDRGQGRQIMREIVAAGTRSGFASHSWADQAAMALASLTTSAARQNWFDAGRQARVERALDDVFRALDEPSRYSPWRYRTALGAFGEEID